MRRSVQFTLGVKRDGAWPGGAVGGKKTGWAFHRGISVPGVGIGGAPSRAKALSETGLARNGIPTGCKRQRRLRRIVCAWCVHRVCSQSTLRPVQINFGLTGNALGTVLES